MKRLGRCRWETSDPRSVFSVDKGLDLGGLRLVTSYHIAKPTVGIRSAGKENVDVKAQCDRDL